MNASHLGIVTH